MFEPPQSWQKFTDKFCAAVGATLTAKNFIFGTAKLASQKDEKRNVVRQCCLPQTKSSDDGKSPKMECFLHATNVDSLPKYMPPISPYRFFLRTCSGFRFQKLSFVSFQLPWGFLRESICFRLAFSQEYHIRLIRKKFLDQKVASSCSDFSFRCFVMFLLILHRSLNPLIVCFSDPAQFMLNATPPPIKGITELCALFVSSDFGNQFSFFLLVGKMSIVWADSQSTSLFWVIKFSNYESHVRSYTKIIESLTLGKSFGSRRWRS